jgi:biopolymer transport protein ExbD
MKIGGSQEIHEARVELVPLIDCVFLLLIFFMCCASMSSVDTSSEVHLPVASNAAEQKDPSHRGTVNILPSGVRTPENELVTDARPFRVYGTLVDDQELQRIIAEHVKEDPNLRLYLRADRQAKFVMVRRAMAACANAGVADVIFATHLEDSYLDEGK